MIKKLILIVILTYGTFSFSQEKDFWTGEWKIIAIKTINYSYNSTTGSFSWSKDYQKLLPGIIKDFGYKNSEELIEVTKKQITSDRFIFQKDSIYLRKLNTQILRQGSYSINSSKKTIHFKDDKDKPGYSMKYSIKKDQLYLTIQNMGSFKPTKFILQRTAPLLQS